MKVTSEKHTIADKKKKTILVANSSWYLINFRKQLIQELQKSGYQVILVAPHDEHFASLSLLNTPTWQLPLNRKSITPWNELATIQKLVQIYQEEQPNFVHHFTLKCILSGSIAAFIARVPKVINSFTGLGHIYTSQSTKAALARGILKPVFKFLLNRRNVYSVFQNEDDQKLFINSNILKSTNSSIIATSGVDTEYFKPSRPKSTQNSEVRILYAARLLKEKGIFEFIQAIDLLGEKGVKVSVTVAGEIDEGNPSSVDRETLQLWKNNKNINFIGHTKNIKNELADSAIFVLPSYREGGSKVIIEAASMEVAVVTTNVPGCKNLVEHKQTGLVVPVKNPEALSEAIEVLIKDSELRKKMGEAGRRKTILEFSEEQVSKKTVDIYSSMASAE